MRIYIASFLALISAGISQASAQSCSDVLVAAYDTNYSKGSTQAYSAAKMAICSRQQGSNSNDSSLAINVPGYGDLNYGHNISGQELSAWCREEEGASFIDQKFQLALSTVHDSVIQAWENCMN